MKFLFSLLLASLVTAGSIEKAGAQAVVTGPLPLVGNGTVVTGGTAQVVILSNTAFNGCYIQNDPNSGINLVIDPVGTANSTTPSATSSILTPNATWSCPGNLQHDVSITASDTGHKFYGIRY
jgi:hypothetical protein